MPEALLLRSVEPGLSLAELKVRIHEAIALEKDVRVLEFAALITEALRLGLDKEAYSKYSQLRVGEIDSWSAGYSRPQSVMRKLYLGNIARFVPGLVA